MKKLLGWMMTGGLLLGYASTSEAQITIQPGRNGSPSVTFGQPAYGPQYAPTYRPNYAQPGYGQPQYQPNYVQPGYGQPAIDSYQPGTYVATPYYPGAAYHPVYSTTTTPAIRGLMARSPGITTPGITRTHSRIPTRERA